MVSREEHTYSPCPWRFRVQKVNKVDKRENVNIGHCVVTSIRGKVVISAAYGECSQLVMRYQGIVCT